MALIDGKCVVYLLLFWRFEVVMGYAPVACAINFLNIHGTPLKTMELRPKLVEKEIAYVQDIKHYTDQLDKTPGITNVTLICSGLVKFSETTVCIRKGDDPRKCWQKYAHHYIPYTTTDIPIEDYRIFGKVLESPIPETVTATKFKTYRSARFIGPLKHIGPDKTYNAIATYEGPRFQGRGIYFELEEGKDLDMKDTKFTMFSHVNVGKVRWYAYPKKNYKGTATPIGLPPGKNILARDLDHVEAKSFRSELLQKGKQKSGQRGN